MATTFFEPIVPKLMRLYDLQLLKQENEVWMNKLVYEQHVCPQQNFLNQNQV